MRHRIPGLLLGSLCLAALSSCHSTGEASGRELVLREVRHGRFEEALDRATRLLEAAPGDASLQALHRDVQVALRLDRGRDQVFLGQLDEALTTFQEAADLAPENEVVRTWIRKTQLQLADAWLDRASDLSGTDRLEEVSQAYEKVLEHDPGNPTAIEGRARTLLLMNYRSGQSKSYFDEGLTGFRRLKLEQARRDFHISNEFKGNDPARERMAQVEQQLAEERLEQAEQFEQDGFWFAAANEYRLALLIDPESERARAGLDRMDRETRAATSLSDADMKVRRGELDDARETLETVEDLTEAQKDSVSLLQAGIEEKGFEELYDRALSLTEDYRYPEAVVAYDELLAVAPHFRDAEQKKATLQEFIALAEEWYQQALAAESDADAMLLLRNVLVVWPEYKDTNERLAKLEARTRGQPEDAASSDPAGTEADAGAPPEEVPAEEPPEPESDDGGR